jgi:hypothetical protein
MSTFCEPLADPAAPSSNGNPRAWHRYDDSTVHRLLLVVEEALHREAHPSDSIPVLVRCPSVFSDDIDARTEQAARRSHNRSLDHLNRGC